ncbi:hypothetical protein REJC140_00152 [Pseudorhizobium endolithicum]|uniref:Uncharacterized protein n=1 Tax=Pseudorhizobium endolithicum TaxID=1191678 RepID=A0ABM8PCU0_9HYPH|nr:hypothetical protein [Pseudorhizobium endolithicum]CAD7023277.1 hypothetical protein REJC140_00152 [Pseudorhizobium endolithicum]
MVERSLIEPVKVEFAGRDADAHRMDALLLGQSLSGMARVYNSVGHYHFHRQIKASAHSEVRVQVGPPERGSIFYLIYMMMVHGKMAVYPELLFSLAEMAVPSFIKAIVAQRTGQTKEMDKALDIIQQQSAQYHELALEARKSDQQIREGLLDVVKTLAANNRAALSDMAAPVGKTVNEVRQVPKNADPIVIDTPTAAALRSKEEVTVGEMATFRGVFRAVDTTTGSFRLEDEDGKEYRGKITDPALLTPQNFYTHALDTQEVVAITAKPTLNEDGTVHRLFVSDAGKAS